MPEKPILDRRVTERMVAIDVETTGFAPKKNRIVAIGLVEVNYIEDTRYKDEHGNPIRSIDVGGTEFEAFFNPEVDFIHPGAIEVNGLELEFLRQHPTFASRIPEIVDFIDGARLIGHNLTFDHGFLHEEFARNGVTPNFEYGICTLEMARKTWPGAEHRLESLCRRLRIKYDATKLHSALYDARLAAQCYVKLHEKDARFTYENPTPIA